MGGNSSSEMASPVVISPKAKHTATVIFLHGLGDTGHGWASSFREIALPYVKYICPHAPAIPVSLNAGFVMPSWFDLYSLDAEGPEDEAGIKKALMTVHQLIEAEEKIGIPTSRIMIGGFSQGGALSLYSAFRLQKPLAGIIGLSTWLPLAKEFPSGAIGNREVDILQCHGDADNLVPLKWGELTAKKLRDFVKSVDFKTYRGLSHSSCPEEMQDVQEFIKKQLPDV